MLAPTYPNQPYIIHSQETNVSSGGDELLSSAKAGKPEPGPYQVLKVKQPRDVLQFSSAKPRKNDSIYILDQENQRTDQPATNDAKDPKGSLDDLLDLQ